MAEWASGHNYSTRVNNILGVANPMFSQRLNGQNFLNSTTVHQDKSPEILIGGPGRDWFFANLMGPLVQQDLIFRRKSNETVTQI